MSTIPKRDAAQEITDYFIKQLEEGSKPWVRSWDTAACGAAPLRYNGERYHGINHFYLDLMQYSLGFSSPYWLTFQQAKTLGGQVRKGSKGQISILYRTVIKQGSDTPPEEFDPQNPDHQAGYSYKFLKYYIVFNADQIDGLPDRFHPGPADFDIPPSSRQAAIDEFFGALPVNLSHGGARAFYRPVTDQVVMPPLRSFKSSDHYASVLAHECTHWTGGAARLARKFGSFGSQAYAREELIAEIGSFLLCRHLRLPMELDENHVSYVASWLEILKNDKTAILAAAAKAQLAFSHLQSYQADNSFVESEAA